MDKILLSIDCGTQSLRALLYSLEGELLDKEQIKYEPYFSPSPGWAEQDPEIFWNSLREACRSLKLKHPKWFQKISGLGVSTQRDSLINVDREGRALRPVITWLDQRKASPVYHPSPIMKLIYKLAGVEESIMKTQTDGQCNWIQQNQPEIWRKTYKYLQVSGFLHFRLTGEAVDSIASQIGHLPFNYKKQMWAAKSDLSSLLFPVEKEKLPKLITPGGLAGRVTARASSETGIPEGTPLIACGSDKGCETLAMGVLNEKSAALSFGTTATVQTTTKKYCEPLKFMPPYPAAIPGYYNPEVEIFRGFWMVNWFKEEFAHAEIEQAQKEDVPAEEVLNQLLKNSPPGAMGLMAQPYWSPGLKQLSAKGAIIGFGDVHKKSHVYRAVIEGLCYALLDGLRKIEKAAKTSVNKVMASGGASQSDEICQIAADIFNIPLLRGKTHETSGLGAAIITAVGLKLYPDFNSAIQNMVKYEKTFNPIPENAALYKKMFAGVYQKIEKTLKPLNEEIRAITNYPEMIQ